MPANYVKQVEPEPTAADGPNAEGSESAATAASSEPAAAQPTWVALYKYKAADATEVSLKKRDVVLEVVPDQEGWVRGKVQSLPSTTS